MNLLKLSWQNIIARPLGSVLSIVLLGLSILLISVMLHLSKQFDQLLYRNINGIDMVLGAKGSPLQVILSAVFQVDVPTGNISMQEANKLRKSPFVKTGIPLAYGDSYQGFRIVGTDTNYLELYEATFSEGAAFQQAFEVVVGATAAKQLQLKIGQTFHSQHGFDQAGEEHHTSFKVVGILQPSGTVIDKLLLTPLSSIWDLHEQHEEEESGKNHHEKHEEEHHKEHAKHEEEHHEEHESDEDRQITAMLIKFRNPMGIIQLPRYVNEKTNMQAAMPVYEVNRLIALMDGGISLLRWLAFFIMIVSSFSIFIGLYHAMKERQYEMALLRNFGATRWQLVSIVLQEGMILTLLGYVVGILFGRLTFWSFSKLSDTIYQFHLSTEWFLVEELYLMLAVFLLGILASLLPAIQVFKLSISKVLATQ